MQGTRLLAVNENNVEHFLPPGMENSAPERSSMPRLRGFGQGLATLPLAFSSECR